MYDDIGRIEHGLATFVDVGEALLYIRDGKKYRAAKYATFEEYCRERWGFDRTRAHRLIEAADVVSMLPMGNTPTNERQVRELIPLNRSTAHRSRAGRHHRPDCGYVRLAEAAGARPAVGPSGRG